VVVGIPRSDQRCREPPRLGIQLSLHSSLSVESSVGYPVSRYRVRRSAYSLIRSSRWTVTVSPACLPMAVRTSVLTGSLCRPSPSAMNALVNGWPSTVPATLTSPPSPEEVGRPVGDDIGPSAGGVALLQRSSEGLGQ